ncbi:hypothetical protein [Catenuloplanes japonicus]|uniref:hypothetical protein n=1 Tax=Catenuloplanes japonicus TaxID=33876 RepID=UPI0005276C52|nr:hypothetical protein [Catenuloplanes japonicus]
MILRFGAALALVLTTSPLSPSPAGTVTTAVPDPPVDVVAVAGVSSIRVSWGNPPMELGVANYVAYAEPGGATCDTLDWRTFGCVLGATAGVSYRVFVRSNGTSVPAYAPGSVTPRAPKAPHDVPTDALDLGVEVADSRAAVRGDGFLPRSTVALAAYRADGHATVTLPVAGVDGRVSASITLPPGTRTLLAQGVGPDGEVRALVAAVGSGSGGGLPVTGVRVLIPLAVGVLLLVLGAATLLAGRGNLSRRRQPAPTARPGGRER